MTETQSKGKSTIRRRRVEIDGSQMMVQNRRSFRYHYNASPRYDVPTHSIHTQYPTQREICPNRASESTERTGQDEWRDRNDCADTTPSSGTAETSLNLPDHEPHPPRTGRHVWLAESMDPTRQLARPRKGEISRATATSPGRTNADQQTQNARCRMQKGFLHFFL